MFGKETLPGSQKPDVFEYSNYRLYITAFIEYKKSLNPRYTFSQFARRVSMSKSLFHKILEGSRNLTEENLPKFCDACELVKREATYFQALVRYNQCDDPALQGFYWENLLRSSPQDCHHFLTKNEEKLIGHWFIFALIELIRLPNFVYDPESISRRLFYKVSPDEVDEAISQLESFGYIVREGRKVTLTKKEILIGRSLDAGLIKEYHKKNIPLAVEALLSIPASSRDFNSTSLALRHEDVPVVKEKIRELLDSVMELSLRTHHPTDVFQLNIQLFPYFKDEGTV